MQMESHIHPGDVIRRCLDDLELSVTDAAKVLGVSRSNFSRLINCRGGVTPEMSIRLAKAFGTTPDYWLQLQFNHELKEVRSMEKRIHVDRYRPEKELMIQPPLSL